MRDGATPGAGRDLPCRLLPPAFPGRAQLERPRHLPLLAGRAFPTRLGAALILSRGGGDGGGWRREKGLDWLSLAPNPGLGGLPSPPAERPDSSRARFCLDGGLAAHSGGGSLDLPSHRSGGHEGLFGFGFGFCLPCFANSAVGSLGLDGGTCPENRVQLIKYTKGKLRLGDEVSLFGAGESGGGRFEI